LRISKIAVGGVILGSFGFLLQSVQACERGPSYCEQIDVSWEDPTSSRPLPLPKFAILGLQPGKSDLRDLRDELGDAPLMRGDECGGGEFCFQSPDNEQPATLIADMWGDQLRSLTMLATRLRDKQCIVSHSVKYDLGTNGGLRLGITSGEVEEILGPPRKKMPTGMVYSYERRIRMTDRDIQRLEGHWARAVILEDPFWNDWSVIEVGLKDSRVRCFRVQNTKTW
jgi:hypothetical protein